MQDISPAQQPAHMPVAEPPQQQHTNPSHVVTGSGKSPKGLKGALRRFKTWYRHLNKKQRILFFVALLLLMGGGGAGAWYLTKQSEPAPEKTVKKEKLFIPETKASCLTGMHIPKNQNPLTTGIMMENSPAARPQSGLYQAEVVFEAIAEGGITRFLTLFERNQPKYVGPVRSLRPYYLTFLLPFDAPIAHAGGSGEALAQVSKSPFKDLEAFRHPGYYQRVSSRAAPHNLYTNRANLIGLQKELGWKKTSCKGFPRNNGETMPAKKPTAQTIDLNISSGNYNVRFNYDKKTNSFKRRMGGVPHIDERANKQISPKVVVAMVMSHHYEGIYSKYGTKGSGRVFIFQDGKVTKGTWHKINRKTQYSFRDNKKKPLKLNPGKTWVTIVGSADKVKVTPAK